MHISRRSLPAVLLLLLLPGCGGEEEAALRVGGLSFTPDEVEGLSAADSAVLQDLAALATAVAAETVDSLVAPLAAREVEKSRLQALPELLAARRAGISEERLREAYASAPEWELTVRHVVRLVPRWASGEARTEARRLAAEAERRAAAGEDFGGLAAELSEEPGAAERGGLLQPGREGSWVEPFWRAALQLRPGETSPVVETEYGYHVLRLDARRTLPFEEAARLPILRRLVPRPQALAAMEEWVATRPPVVLDPHVLLAARESLRGGAAPDSLVMARSPAGTPFTAHDLALAWAVLPTDAREGLERADDGSFAEWAAAEARESFWAEAAREAGAEPFPGTATTARTRLAQRIGALAASFGIREGMTGEGIEAAVLSGVSGTGQEARIGRMELGAMRPLLRRAYPAR